MEPVEQETSGQPEQFIVNNMQMAAQPDDINVMPGDDGQE